MGVLECLIRGLGRRSGTRRADCGGRKKYEREALLTGFGLPGLALAEFEALEFSGGGFG
jgi:hypothetical protein